MKLLSQIREQVVGVDSAVAKKALRGTVNVYSSEVSSMRELSVEECAAVAGGIEIWGGGGPIIGPAGH